MRRRGWPGRAKGLAMCVLAASAATLPAVAGGQSPVRVVSFNLRYGTANDGDHRWELRRAAVIATIRDHSPHLLGVQEALRFQLDELAAAFPVYREIGVGRDDGLTNAEYSAILVDTARYAVLDEGTFWLSDTPEVPGSMHWGNRITRITTWVRLADRTGGDTVSVFNLHWDHESQPSRERSAVLLLERLAAVSAMDAVIVTGDFNSDESNPAFRRLTSGEGPLRDTFRARHPDAVTVGTFNSFRGDSSGGKIDAVLTGPRWQVLDAGIDRSLRVGVLASDHYAVWAIVRRDGQKH